MLPELQEIKRTRKQYSKVLTNRMTIAAWKLFKKDPILHFAFILYRLRNDFNFTAWEIANFTGIPTRQVQYYMKTIKPILDSEVLKVLAKMDYKGELEMWNEHTACNGLPQGYVVVHDYPAHYSMRMMNKERYQTIPEKKFGDVTQKEYEKMSGKKWTPESDF